MKRKVKDRIKECFGWIICSFSSSFKEKSSTRENSNQPRAIPRNYPRVVSGYSPGLVEPHSISFVLGLALSIMSCFEPLCTISGSLRLSRSDLRRRHRSGSATLGPRCSCWVNQDSDPSNRQKPWSKSKLSMSQFVQPRLLSRYIVQKFLLLLA